MIIESKSAKAPKLGPKYPMISVRRSGVMQKQEKSIHW